MEKKVLICDSSSSIGDMLSDGLLRRGVLSLRCHNSKDAIRSAFTQSSPQTAILIIYAPDESWYSFVAELKALSPSTHIVTGVFSGLRSVHVRFILSGASRSFGIPFNIKHFFTELLGLISHSGSRISHTESFLRDSGFPSELKGFRYLAAAVDICTDNTALLSGGITELYRIIAEKFRTDARAVERSVRNLTDITKKSGVLEQFTRDRTAASPSNKELICIACDISISYLRSMSS